jgi:5-oxoprolinase (ATP-hydrolysing)
MVRCELNPATAFTTADFQNLSDLHAQVASCHRGVHLIKQLIEEQSLEVVDYYMHAIMLTAEKAVRDLLRKVSKRFGGMDLQAVDWLDDGTELRLRVEIDREKGDAVFDFTGTGPQV